MMIGAAGSHTVSATVERDSSGCYHILVRAFDHPDPERTLPSGTTPRHVVSAQGESAEDAMRAVEEALAKLTGPLDWTRWRFLESR
ncbi:MAG: hypothetical protein M5U08_07585 [Burkholderiales bacterium]|nr:hypothetical protein [Burkholderiales bacterium]